MSANPSILAQLLRPFPAERFLSQYREKKPLTVRGRDRNKFSHLLSLESIDQIISSGYLRHPECKLAIEGAEIPVKRYVVGDPSRGLIDTEAFFHEYANGASIVVNAAHRYWPPLSQFCRDLERFFSMPVHANVYLTPANSQGFGAHYDPHDVFILQIAGSKRWRLYGSPLTLPDEEQLFNSSLIEVGAVRDKCTLGPGDLLYIPRGHLHDARAATGASLHVTVGVKGVTWGDLLLAAVRILSRSDPSLRTSLPTGFADRGSIAASLRPRFLHMKSRMMAKLPLAQALEEIADQFASRSRQRLEGHLEGLEHRGRFTLDTKVARRPDLIFRRWKQGDKTCILFFRKVMRFPGFVAPALKFIVGAGTFRPRDVPGDLSDKSKLLLCRRLAEEGFLRTLADQ